MDNINNNERYDEAKEMTSYIWKILRTQPNIFLSWGIMPSDLKPIVKDDMVGCEFEVNGFKHQGKVNILYNEGEDLFEVRLLDSDGKAIKTETQIYLDCLVAVIDGLVERTDNYIQDVENSLQ